MSKITINLAHGCEFESVPTNGVGVVNDPQGKLIFFAFSTPHHPTDMEGKENESVMQVDCERVLVSKSADYGEAVSAIIRSRYSANEVEAIVLNHGDGNADHEAEYAALQQWRTEAKRIAKEVLSQRR